MDWAVRVACLEQPPTEQQEKRGERGRRERERERERGGGGEK